MRKPNFFIVGAGRSGTSSMESFLQQHPEVFMARRQINFFDSDLHYRIPRLTFDNYLYRFRKAKNEKRVGETANTYLISKTAPYEIKKFSPNADIIIMLRNPVDNMFSVYHHQRTYFREDLDKFEDALEAEEDRKKGYRIPKNIVIHESIFYRHRVKYTEFVKRYFDVFGPNKVHIIIFDEFKDDTKKVYKETCKFLGINESFSPNFEISNSYKKLRSKYLHLLMSIPKSHLIKKLILTMPDSWTTTLVRWNQKTDIERPVMNPVTRKKLQKEFSKEIKSLGTLIEEDLTYWLYD